MFAIGKDAKGTTNCKEYRQSRSFDISQTITSRIQVTAKHHHCVSPNNCKQRLDLLKTGRKVYLKCHKVIAGIFQEALQDKGGP